MSPGSGGSDNLGTFRPSLRNLRRPTPPFSLNKSQFPHPNRTDRGVSLMPPEVGGSGMKPKYAIIRPPRPSFCHLGILGLYLLIIPHLPSSVHTHLGRPRISAEDDGRRRKLADAIICPPRPSFLHLREFPLFPNNSPDSIIRPRTSRMAMGARGILRILAEADGFTNTAAPPYLPLFRFFALS